MKSIEERAYLAAWQIFEEIGLSKQSVDRVADIIAEKIIEQKYIDINKADEWIDNYIMGGKDKFRKVMEEWILWWKNEMIF